MPEIENPYRTEGARKPSPGELAHTWANFLAMWAQFAGVSFTVQETESLGTVINAILRSYPRLRDIAVDLGTKDEHKE
jgi:hypothetical protein